MSRKYRQRGYQDDDVQPRRRQQKPRERREGPRGRGLGAPTATLFKCARCGARRPLADQILADTVCAKCGADLHTCTNCRHFDTSAPKECRKPVPERIARKAERNECELFEPKTVQDFEPEQSRPDDPKAAFDSLFDF